MRAALYARVSLDKQRENFSIPTQLEAMREYCQRDNWPVVKEYIEDESGAKLTRPTLDQVREDVAEGLFDILVCHDVDRFGRNLGHQILLEEEFAKHGVEVRYVLGDYKDNPEGRLTKHIKGVIAEYEREKIMERTLRGRLGRAKSGQVNVSHPDPYGYTYRSEGRRGWLEVVSEEAEMVTGIYRLYVEEGLSSTEIAARLTARQFPTRTGCQWNPGTVRGILQSETYVGVWYENKRSHSKGRNPRESWIPVSVPPIISRELWDAAQERRIANRERLRRHPKHPYLLSGGMLRCGSCGRVFSAHSSYNSRRPKPHHYYRCTDEATGYWKHEHCHEGLIRAEDADALVWNKIAEVLRNPELLAREYNRQLENGSGINAQERISQIGRELNKLKTQENRNLDLYTEDEIDMPTLKKRQEKLRGQRANLDREKKALEKMLGRNNADMVSITQFCQLISQGLDAVTFEEKRQILRLLNVEGRVKDGVITLTGCIPSAESCAYSASHLAATINKHNNHNIPFVLEITLPLRKPKPRRWTKDEMELLVKLYPVRPNRDLALKFGRTEDAVRQKYADCISDGVEIYQQH